MELVVSNLSRAGLLGSASSWVTTKDEHRAKTRIPCAIYIVETVVQLVLRREKRYDVLLLKVVSEIGYQVTRVVFLSDTDSAVRQEGAGSKLNESADRMAGVDPRFHASCRCQFCPWWREFGGDKRFFP